MAYESTIQSGKVDLEKLLKRTKHHPKGRVQIDEMTGEVKNPKNQVLQKDVEMKKAEDGKDIFYKVDRQGDHALGDDPVWRVAMLKKKLHIGKEVLTAECPQELYHKMCLYFERMQAAGKKRDDFRPELTEQEMTSYLLWKEEMGLSTAEEAARLDVLAPGRKKKEKKQVSL